LNPCCLVGFKASNYSKIVYNDILLPSVISCYQ
jgi:hypothetical protein